jgi:hypothetical protein
MSRSIGLALTDTLDDLISDERINPQLAMKILSNFDQAITEALQRNVKNRLSFKVGGIQHTYPVARPHDQSEEVEGNRWETTVRSRYHYLPFKKAMRTTQRLSLRLDIWSTC